jgi:tRNA-splicing ligase RtcB (3'-phosphate/5'-hydroxy nucleic acid ligase)
MAQKQLGTVGSGNHYVDLFEDESGFVWIGVHFGSRGFGHKTATAFLKLGGGTDGMDVDPCVLHQDSELGERYVRAMRLAGVYAYAGREWVVEKVNSIIGGTIAEEVNNHHNYAWREEHGGQDYWVVRKGATPAFPGQHGFVGGSMGDDAVILSGVDSEVSKASLYSTVHGAGRVMSRTQARGKWRKGVQRTEGLIRYDDWQTWLREKGVTVLGGDVDEAPQAYRRLPDVLQAHAGTVQVEHTLRPFGVVMAGSKEFDPYKD